MLHHSQSVTQSTSSCVQLLVYHTSASTYPSKHTSCQSTSPDKAPAPLSIGAQAAVSSPSILAQHLRTLPLHSVRLRCLSRRMKMGESRLFPLRDRWCWEERCLRMRRMGWTLWTRGEVRVRMAAIFNDFNVVKTLSLSVSSCAIEVMNRSEPPLI